MILNFQKYHGTGNDFIIIDNRDGVLSFPRSIIPGLCDRHFGIGADGLILIGSTGGYDFHMHYFNADGSSGAMCGNGARCSADFFHRLVGRAKDRFHFLAADGAHEAEVLKSQENDSIVKVHLSDITLFRNDRAGIYVDSGAPHLVVAVDSVDDIALPEEGRNLRYSPEYSPEGVNVDFMETSGEKLRIRTYERGVEAETLSCGTGATASAAAAAILAGQFNENIRIIETLGGKLSISFFRQGNSFRNIWLEGPVKRVFTGTININPGNI